MGGDVKLLCLDGDLGFNEGSPECTKLGTLVLFLWCTGFGILIVALQYGALNLALTTKKYDIYSLRHL